MVLKRQFARILAAVILIAAFGVPSAARAHDGHGHHRTAVDGTAAHSNPSTLDKTLTSKSHSKIVSVRVAPPRSATAPVGMACDGHCCGAGAGMACCGAALAPTLFDCSVFFSSVPFVIRNVPPAYGLAPEALPKPPKSFA